MFLSFGFIGLFHPSPKRVYLPGGGDYSYWIKVACNLIWLSLYHDLVDRILQVVLFMRFSQNIPETRIYPKIHIRIGKKLPPVTYYMRWSKPGCNKIVPARAERSLGEKNTAGVCFQKFIQVFFWALTGCPYPAFDEVFHIYLFLCLGYAWRHFGSSHNLAGTICPKEHIRTGEKLMATFYVRC